MAELQAVLSQTFPTARLTDEDAGRFRLTWCRSDESPALSGIYHGEVLENSTQTHR
jgi:hypothetical protein